MRESLSVAVSRRAIPEGDMSLKSWIAVACAAGTIGCSSTRNDLSASDVADSAASQSGALVREFGASTDFLSSLTALQAAFDAASTQAGLPGATGATATPIPAPPPAGLTLAPFLSAIQPSATTQNPLLSAGRWVATTVTDPGTATSSDQAASELETFLRQRVFTEGNLETADSRSAIFRLRGEAICTDGTYAADPGCVSTVNDLELRIHATKSGDGFDYQFLVGPTRANPVTLSLRSDSAGLAFDLGGIKTAAEHIETVTGTTIDLPAVMEGAFGLAVTRLGAAHVKIALSVLSALHVRVDATDGSYDFTTQPAEVLAFDADGTAGVLSWALGLGATTFSLPYVGNVAAASPSGFTTFGIALGGLSYKVSATVAAPDVVEILDVGLGTETSRVWASKADATVVDAVVVDLNPNDGRKLDVTVQDDAATGTTVTFTSKLDVTVGLHLGLLDLDSAPSASADDDTYRILLSDPAADPVLFAPIACDPLVATCPASAPSFQLTSGSLELSADDGVAVSTVTVAEGECLYEDGAGTHPVLGNLYAAACP